MPIWNEEQKRAIYTKNKNILISASAGSGKTTVLVARLLELVLEDHISLNHILAMTFTEAAASEMRKRLTVSLQHKYHTTVNIKEKEYIQQEIANIQTAQISTIHSFCLSIIQEYYYVIQLNPKRIQTIMDDAQMNVLKEQAFDEVLKTKYQEHDATFIQLLEILNTRSEDLQNLKNTVFNIVELLSTKEDSTQWITTTKQMYHHIQSIQDLPKTVQTYFYDYLHMKLSQYQALCDELYEHLQMNYPSEIKKIAEMETKLHFIKPIHQHLHHYSQYRYHFLLAAQKIAPTSPQKEDEKYKNLRDNIQSLEDDMAKILFDESIFCHHINSQSIYVDHLLDMSTAFITAYTNLKEAHQVIDFNDMEHYALAILKANNGMIANIYKERFDEIMVDEFQDSNDVQHALVTYICQNNNVFRVGDIKQSIYGFRHAKPELMQRLITHQQEEDEIIYLANNYRSKQTIIDFNNILFDTLMNFPSLTIDFNQYDQAYIGIDSQKDQNHAIQFHALLHNQINEKEQLTLSKNELKASYIVKKMIDIKEKEQRQWKDFVILTRGNARKQDLRNVFDEYNIPYFIDIKHGFYQSAAIELMRAALKCFISPHDDIAFVSVFLSPFLNGNAEDLVIAKLAKEKTQSYYEYFLKHPFPLFENFDILRNQAIQLPLHHVLDLLFDFHQYYETYTTLQEKTNLDLLYDKALQFEETKQMNIASFLSHMDQIQDYATAEAIPIGSEEDVVRVMSIHQSKGLQFPVVFLWSSDSLGKEETEICIQDESLGLAMKYMELPNRYVATTIPRIAMKHKKQKEMIEEEMRILYVATTRPQEQLHIVDCIKTIETYQKTLQDYQLYEQKGYTSWILQHFLNHPSPLFQLHIIEDYWHIQQKKSETNIAPKQLRFKQAIQQSKETTASSHSIHIPLFSLTKSTAMDHGTMIHNMIECLPKGIWDEQMIQKVASPKGYQLSPHDVNKLIHLSKNKIFQNMNQMPYIYHELPYIVKEHEQIIHGFIDYVSVDEQQVMIVDFKTDALKEEQDFINAYSSQLNTYREAIHILYPNKHIETYIYSLYLNKMISIS